MALDPIDLTALFNTLGITNGNTGAKNQYEFFKGVEWSDTTTTYTAKEFFDKIGGRYSFFKTYESEKSFYAAVDDNRIYDYNTFYKWAGEFFGSSSSIISLDNLILYYKFNDDATDSSGRGYDGQNVGASVAYVADYPGGNTAFGKAYDGSGERALANNIAKGFDIPTRANRGDVGQDYSTSFTCAFWVKSDWFGNGGIAPISVFSGPLNYPPFGILWYSSTQGQATRTLAGGTTQKYALFTKAITNNTWTHVLLTFRKTADTVPAGFRLYFDGVLAGSDTDTTNNQSLVSGDVGGMQVGVAQYIPGQGWFYPWGNKISDLSYWDRALTATEIAILSDASNGPLIS